LPETTTAKNACALEDLVARPLPRRFYARGAEVVARDLLGAILEREVGGHLRRARIVETEAYVGLHDLAAHSSKGRTLRNEAMWGQPGHAYVYFIYGLFWMLNVVTAAKGDPQAVLLRAAEPLDGWLARLNGPALLAKAFHVQRADNQADLVAPSLDGLRIVAGTPCRNIAVDRRIGVDYAGDWAHAQLRFLDADSPHVSRRKLVSGKAPTAEDRLPNPGSGKPGRQRPHS